MSMCFDLSWWEGLEAKWIVDLLSQNSMVDLISTSKCPSKHLRNTTSLATDDNAQYSNSVEDFETVPCFIDFYEISASPRNTQNPFVDLRVSR